MAEDSLRNSLSDDDLVRLVQSGDRRAMDELVDRHHGVVFRTCVAILNDEDLAADASQNCFIKALPLLGQTMLWQKATYLAGRW